MAAQLELLHREKLLSNTLIIAKRNAWSNQKVNWFMPVLKLDQLLPFHLAM